jgi:N-acetylglucosamine kinase-like BadF-type ATPase
MARDLDVVVGIDGGGTKTAAVILNRQGKVLGYGEGGPSTYGIVPDDVTAHSIATAVAGAASEAGQPDAGRFGAAFLGLGNVVSQADCDAVRAMAVRLGLAQAERIGVDHDCRVALAGGLSGRPGIVLIAGTGTSCYGINAAGESWRAGGWGPLIDDEGSSYWLGIQAMRAAVLDEDGRGERTLLHGAVMQALGLEQMNGLMNRLYAAAMSRTEIAALAPLVFESAAQGDPVADGLIRTGCAAMADCVLAVARRLGMDQNRSELALVGGLARAGAALTAPLEAEVTRRLPGCTLLPAELPPALGAGLLALEIAGIAPSIAVVENLSAFTRRADDPKMSIT